MLGGAIFSFLIDPGCKKLLLSDLEILPRYVAVLLMIKALMFGMLYRRPLSSFLVGSSLYLGFSGWNCGGKIQACLHCVLLSSRIHNPREEHLVAQQLQWPSDINLGFSFFLSMSLLSKPVLAAPMIDFAFFILVSIYIRRIILR